MAKKTDSISVPEPVADEFPVTLDEFIHGLTSSVGAKAAFRHAASEITGKKMRSEWQRLFDNFMQSPAGTKITGS